MEPVGEKLLQRLRGLFCRYASLGFTVQTNLDTYSRCNSDSLSRDGLRKLLDEQFPNYLKCPEDPKEFDELFKKLDQNCDQRISFEEYTVLIRDVLLTIFEKCQCEGGDGDRHHP